MKTLRLILGDQLNLKHSWFNNISSDVTYVLMEMRQETDYTVHHIQKIIGFFAAMRDFSENLSKKGHNVIYFDIHHKQNTQDLKDNLNLLISSENIKKFEYLEPDEYRLDVQLKKIVKNLGVPSTMVSTEHFYTERFQLKEFYKGKKQYVMESFYRHMRKKYDLLMVAGQPEGGKWNFDKSNRQKWNKDTLIPPYKYFKNDVSKILSDIKKTDIRTMGNFKTKTFLYPINREQAIDQLKYFCEHLLVYFGDYQDAMHTDEVYLYHSRLSFAMNLKLISPKDVINTFIRFYRKHKDDIHISQVEGFIRQIIGWREYMRGMYWMLMPGLKEDNYLNNHNRLADFYWTAETKMNCLKHAIANSLDNGYAHHIQRLMITGNYALLTQTNPDEVDAWYLGIYVDAVEWVQLPNTRGMSQFADGGKIATKPYISSGSYINKMSNYCKNCHYKISKKTTAEACPFNSLYWNFLSEKESKLKDNPRMTMMYSLMEKMDSHKLNSLIEKGHEIINNQDNY